jgi:hypothetical protein
MPEKEGRAIWKLETISVVNWRRSKTRKTCAAELQASVLNEYLQFWMYKTIKPHFPAIAEIILYINLVHNLNILD